MGIEQQIEIKLAEKEITKKELAEKMDITPQQFLMKMKSNNIKLNDLIKIADILGCDVKLVDREADKIAF